MHPEANQQLERAFRACPETGAFEPGEFDNLPRTLTSGVAENSSAPVAANTPREESAPPPGDAEKEAPSGQKPHAPQILLKDHPRKLLLPYQTAWVDDAARFKFGLMARQTGKDFSAAAEGVLDCFAAEAKGHKTTWLIAAPSERQSLESFEKWKEWTEAFKMTVVNCEEKRHSDGHGESLLKSATITFRNGSRVIAVPGRPDTVRGFSANILLTEFAFFEDPDATWRAILPSITNPLRGGLKRVRLITTPNGIGNKAHELWVKNYVPTGGQDSAADKQMSNWPTSPRPSPPSEGGEGVEECARVDGNRGAGAEQLGVSQPVPTYERGLSNGEARTPRPATPWSCHRVDIHQAVAAGLDINIEELRAALNDPEGWAQEYELQFVDQSSVLLPYDLLTACENPQASETAPDDFWNSASHTPHSALFGGIDFGRTRDLTVCWTIELIGGAVRMTREVLALEKLSSPAQLEILRPRLQRARRVCFDYTGPGVGLGDWLVKEFGEYRPEAHQFGKIELCQFTNALKVDIFPKLRMAFEQRTVAIPMNRVIREDLHSMSRVALAGGGVTYRAPHTADGHADRCTALALALRATTTDAVPFAYVAISRAGSTRPRHLL